MRKILGINIIFVLLLAVVLFWGLETKTYAEEPVSYIYMVKSGEAEAKWYEGDPVIGAEGEVKMEDMVEETSTRYCLMAEPTDEVATYLNHLEKGAFLQIYSNSGKLVLGTEEKPFQIEGISLDSNDFELEVYTDELKQFSLTYGTATIYGDVLSVSLGSDNQGPNEEKQNLTVSGGIRYLKWYRDSDSQYRSFKGNLRVEGVVENGSIYDRVNLEGFGMINPMTYTFENATGSLITEGVLAESVECKETDFADAEYSYRYDCYCWQGWTGNFLEMSVFANGTNFVGSKYLVDFDFADLPENADVFINSNYGEDALVIPKSVHKLHVYGGGKIVVDGDVEELIVEWIYPDKSLSKQTIDLTVNGDVKKLEVWGQGRQVGLTVNGKIESGTWLTRYFTGSGLIIDNGQLQVPSYTNMEDVNRKDTVGTITPAITELENAVNLSEADHVLDQAGNVIASKMVRMNVLKNTTIEKEQKETIEKNNNLDILGIVDIKVFSGYYNVENGNTYIDDTHKYEELKELIKKIPIILTIPQDAQDGFSVFSIIREHEGKYEVLPDTDSDPNTVTVLTDKFSAYMLVKSEELPELIPEPQESVFADISASGWQYTYAKYAYDNGLMTGKGQDAEGKVKFDPNTAIPREEFVQVLYNASGKPDVSIENNYSDVKNAWYKNAVLWAKENNIANGKVDGTFGVSESIRRQDLALMLYKYAGLKGYDLTANANECEKYADGNKVSNYAQNAMDWAITKGIMSGKGNKGEDISTFRLDPAGTATRAECAAMLKNFQDVYGK